jgi:hypothetical protein
MMDGASVVATGVRWAGEDSVVKEKLVRISLDLSG